MRSPPPGSVPKGADADGTPVEADASPVAQVVAALTTGTPVTRGHVNGSGLRHTRCPACRVGRVESDGIPTSLRSRRTQVIYHFRTHLSVTTKSQLGVAVDPACRDRRRTSQGSTRARVIRSPRSRCAEWCPGYRDVQCKTSDHRSDTLPLCIGRQCDGTLGHDTPGQ